MEGPTNDDDKGSSVAQLAIPLTEGSEETGLDPSIYALATFITADTERNPLLAWFARKTVSEGNNHNSSLLFRR